MATISTITTTTSMSTSTTRIETAMATEPRRNYNELCRLCASYDAVRMHIFGQEGKNRQLVDKIETCLPFKVSPSLCSHSLQHAEISCSLWDSQQIIYFLLSLSLSLSLSVSLSSVLFCLSQFSYFLSLFLSLSLSQFRLLF